MNVSQLFNVPSNIAIGQYFLENKGEKTCRSGNEITNNKLCEKACKILSIPVQFKEVNIGTVDDFCFKHTSGECKKNGNNGVTTKRLETYSVNIMQSLPIINGYYHFYTRTIMT